MRLYFSRHIERLGEIIGDRGRRWSAIAAGESVFLYHRGGAGGGFVVNRVDRGPASPADRSILIVDDNPITAKAVELLLGAHYPTAAFQRGSALLAYAEAHGCLPAVVDVHLPDMNGLLVAER